MIGIVLNRKHRPAYLAPYLNAVGLDLLAGYTSPEGTTFNSLNYDELSFQLCYVGLASLARS